MRPPLWICIRTQNKKRSLNLWFPMPFLYLILAPIALLLGLLALPFALIGLIILPRKTKNFFKAIGIFLTVVFETPGLEIHTTSLKQEVRLKVV